MNQNGERFMASFKIESWVVTKCNSSVIGVGVGCFVLFYAYIYFFSIQDVFICQLVEVDSCVILSL